MKCLNCGSTSLCKAHIIPAAAGKDIIKTNDQKLALIAPDNKGWFQSGLFDPNILCSICDGRLGLFDKEAVELTRMLGGNSEIIDKINGVFTVISSNEINHEYLAKFGISVAWRASISSKLDFSLGPNEKWFQNILFGKHAELPAVTIARLVGDTRITQRAGMDALGYPVRVMVKQLSFARFCMRGVMFLVQTSCREDAQWKAGSVTNFGKSKGPNNLTGVLMPFEQLGDLEQIKNSKYIKEILSR